MQMKKKVVIVVNFVVLIILFIFNGLSNLRSQLFPAIVGDISNKFPTGITPSGSTFAIWGFIYFFQAGWIVYSLTLLFRTHAADILPFRLYVFYIISSLCNVSWLLVWSRELVGLSLGFLVAIIMSLALCFDVASNGLFEYLCKYQRSDKKPNPIDVWCVRLLVQNGIIFYIAWVTIATCINFVTTMHYLGHVDRDHVTTGTLAFLLCLTLIWFFLESLLFRAKTRFIFAEYVVLVVALSGVVKKQYTDGSGNQGFVVAILAVSAGLLVSRIIQIFFQERQIMGDDMGVEMPVL